MHPVTHAPSLLPPCASVRLTHWYETFILRQRATTWHHSPRPTCLHRLTDQLDCVYRLRDQLASIDSQTKCVNRNRAAFHASSRSPFMQSPPFPASSAPLPPQSPSPSICHATQLPNPMPVRHVTKSHGPRGLVYSTSNSICTLSSSMPPERVSPAHAISVPGSA